MLYKGPSIIVRSTSPLDVMNTLKMHTAVKLSNAKLSARLGLLAVGRVKTYMLRVAMTASSQHNRFPLESIKSLPSIVQAGTPVLRQVTTEISHALLPKLPDTH